MAELSLLTSATFSPWNFHHDQSLVKPPKEFQALLPGHGKRHDMLRSDCMQIKAPHLEDQWQFRRLSSDYNQQYMEAPMTRKPDLIDVQETLPGSMLFSFGIAEQCTRQKKVLEFLMSGSTIAEGKDLDISLIPDLVGFHAIATDICPQPHFLMEDSLCLYEVGKDDAQQFIHPPRQFYAPKSLMDFVGNLSDTSTITGHPNGHVLFTGSGAEMEDILSIVAEFNLSNNSLNGSKKAMVVPYFTRKRGGHAQTGTRVASPKFEALGPSKCLEHMKAKPQLKKQNRKQGKERDVFSRSYFHACECLLTVFLDKGDSTAILSLKNSSPELTHLLSQFSAGIAGTGLAVLLSVVCKALNGRALPPLSSAKLFSVSFGFGLFWLSGAINSLRDTIASCSKKSSRSKKPKDEEAVAIARSVQERMNAILLRAAMLLAVAAVRL